MILLGITSAFFTQITLPFGVTLWIMLDILWVEMGLLHGWVGTYVYYHRFSWKIKLIEWRVYEVTLTW